MKKTILTIFLFSSIISLANQGPISGGGGGIATYQAIALAQIMSDISNNISIVRKYFPNSGAILKSIEFLGAQRDSRYPNGRSVYLVKNSGGCAVEVEAIAQDWTGMAYSINWGELKCLGFRQ